MRSTLCLGRVSLTAVLVLFTGVLTSACAQTQDSDPVESVEMDEMGTMDATDTPEELEAAKWRNSRPDVATVPVVRESQLDQEEALFLSFWEGMTPAEYVYVARYLTTNPLFQPGEPGQDDRFRVAGSWMTVTPSFGEDGLMDIRLEERLVAFGQAERVFDLYSGKYGPASQPLRNRASVFHRRAWGVACEGAPRSQFGDTTPSEVMAVMSMGSLCHGGAPVDLPGDPTSWSDGVRAVTLSFDGGTSNPTGPFRFFNDLTIRYTTLRIAETEERQARDRDEQAQREHRQAREQERLRQATEAQAETDGI